MWMGLGNDKFKGVEVSEIYIEMKSIIDSMILA
ncbi:hypothetical protein SDC9_151545 [bioreactor metagenome]|uniref:Uncharacterized protein n=1 Tax=bioreactor metagenome TaxID=1076179 RepID=A0A645EQL5_9ZZZZ